jgi:DNA mismatch repair protein MutS2
MIEHTYQVLGHRNLLENLSLYASCPLGRTDCTHLKPSSDLQEIENELRLVSEMRLLLKARGFVPFSELVDLTPVLRKSRAEASWLSPEELRNVFVTADAAFQAKKRLLSERALFPRLSALVVDMPVCADLSKTINESISATGEVKDAASPALKKIRERKVRLRAEVEKKLDQIRRTVHMSATANDSVISVRESRYVISVRSERKREIKGIVHDYSRTGATCFIEPLEIVSDNNRMTDLREEEREEETRVLRHLTQMVRNLAGDLKRAQVLLTRLDGIYARARFAEALSCVMPVMGEGCDARLRGARNPILLMALKSSTGEGDAALVPVDILMNREQNVLIISGPNRGGKTAVLKTLGLLSLMAQSGMHIPAEEGSQLPVFDSVLADIGDDQDLPTGLSTFSAHAAHLNFMITHADRKGLVIIDEPGMGTDPDEGVALAMSVLDHLAERGTFVAVSTHFNRLKAYGLLNRRVINASVEFDEERQSPTFTLHYGTPGMSRALEIARGAGMREDLLDRARAYLDKDEVRLNGLIEKLNGLIGNAERAKAEALSAKRGYDAAAGKMREALGCIEEERRIEIERQREEVEETLKKAREEIREAVNSLKKGERAAQTLVAKTYDDIAQGLRSQVAIHESGRLQSEMASLKIGQSVFHEKLGLTGFVHSADASSGRAVMLCGKVKVSVHTRDLRLLEDAGTRAASSNGGGGMKWNLESSPPRELNLIGYRVKDALPVIDRTIDRALVEGSATLRIIHGFGTGRLKEAIREHLKGFSSVKRVTSEDPQSGGQAITIVELS